MCVSSADSGLITHLCVMGTLIMIGITALVLVQFRMRITSVLEGKEITHLIGYRLQFLKVEVFVL